MKYAVSQLRRLIDGPALASVLLAFYGVAFVTQAVAGA